MKPRVGVILSAQGPRWLWSACCLVLACSQDGTGPAAPRYDLTFDNGGAIYETSVDSPQVRLVMQDSLPTYDLSWSPDGRRVAFTRAYGGEGPVFYYRVLIYNTGDGSQSELTHGPDDSFQPAWSPDGTRIAYLTRAPDSIDATLRTVRPDGTDDRPLGTERYYVRPPDWSPDGRELAATRHDMTIVRVDAVTGAVVRAVAAGVSPTWSPDGRRLAFVADGITNTNVDGSHPTVIAFTGYEPAWSPEGTWIAVEAGDIDVIPPGARDTTAIRPIAPGRRPAWRLRQ